MLLLLSRLSDHCMDDSFEDVLLGDDALHVLDQIVGFIDLIILEVVDDEVQPSLRDDIDERRKDLEGILSSSEDHQVVS